MSFPTDGTAAVEQIEEQIAALTDADLVRLERFARYQVFRYPSINPKEVLGEAVKRVLSGARSWPEGVPFIVFFCNVIRSVASDFRDDAARAFTALDAAACPAGAPELSPDAQAADRAFLAAIWKLFDGDEDARALLSGIESGMTAKEVQRRFEMSSTRYDAARKRLERTLAKRYPNGMES